MPSSLVAPLVGAGVSLLGRALDSGGEQTQQTTNTPWEPQGAHLNSLYGKAEQIVNDRMAAGPYKGATYSPINAIQQGGADRAAAFSGGPGATLANSTGGTAYALQSGAPAFMNNAMSMAANGTGHGDPALSGVLNGYATGGTKLGTVDPALTTALSSAATSGAGAINNFNSGLTNAASMAASDPTVGLAASAGTYANSGYTNAAVDAANANIRQTLGIQNAQSDQNAANRGGLNSSRAGMQIAMNNEAAARLGATNEAAIRGNAFNTGLSTAAGQRTAGLQTATAANIGGITANANLGASAAGLNQRANEFDTSSRLGAATAGIGAANATNQLDFTSKLGANAQLGTGAGLGVSAAESAMGVAGKGFDLANASGGLYQTNENAMLSDQFNKWQRDQGFAQSVLDPYARIVQTGYNGANASTSSGTNTAPSNFAADALGGAALGYGLYDRWQNGAAGRASAAAAPYAGQPLIFPA